MEWVHPSSVSPALLARTVAALANSGGGRCLIAGDDVGAGRAVLMAALGEIVPAPRIHEAGNAGHPGQEMPLAAVGVRPPALTITVDAAGIFVVVTPGTGLCTVGGNVPVIEEGAIRSLTFAEVVRRSGSGG